MNTKWMRITSGVVTGSLVGYGYYYFIGCNTGTCTITSDPFNIMAYGSIMGLILCWPEKKDR